MNASSVHLQAADAAELAELLQFLDDWLGADHETLDTSLAGFVGNRAYDVDQLRADLRRFRRLLDATTGGESPDETA